MVRKIGLATLAAAAIAFSPMAATACAGNTSAQLNDGTQLAQAQNPSPTQQMDVQGSSTQEQQSPASQSDEDK